MKKIFAVMLIVGGVITSSAQVPTRTFENNKAFEKHSNFQISQNNAPEIKMPVFDVALLLDEDKSLEGLDIPFRFGKSFDVNLGIRNGKWVKTDSSEIWGLKISSPKAYSLNFIFSELYLPEGAVMYIFNEDGSMVYGPVTEKQNQHGRTYMTDIIQGETVIIYISIPNTSTEQPILVIQKVVHGYRNVFSNNNLESYGESGDCVENEDIVCYSAWNEESDGIVQILLSNGQELCSGSLLNNTAQDFRPFVLTAFHCIDIGNPDIILDPDENDGVLQGYEIDEAEEWLVRFRFRHTTCRGSTITNGFTYDDTHFRAAWQPTDFALVELQDNIISDVFSVGQKVWLGWDRTGNIPSTVTCIHHPAGDVMKYTYDGESPLVTNYGGTNNSHWLVDDWDIGNTEGGSSGSPLFDQNMRVIGQDHAGDGLPACHEDKGTYFGRLSLSWTGDSTNNTRLSNWLQPIGTATTLNSLRQPTPQYLGIGDLLCSSANVSVTNLAPGYILDHWIGDNISFPNGNTSNPVLISPVSQGEAEIQAVINTGAGFYTMPAKSFWIGPPSASQFDIRNVDFYGSNYLYEGMTNQLIANDYAYQNITEWEWNYGGWNHWEVTSTKYISFVDVPSFSYRDISVRAKNQCPGASNWYTERFYPYDGYYLIISPNPATNETVLSIESASTEKTFDETIEWEVEVYSETQLLKEKRTKLKGKNTTIQTAGWQDGIYMVRVKFKEELLTGRLVVKRM